MTEISFDVRAGSSANEIIGMLAVNDWLPRLILSRWGVAA